MTADTDGLVIAKRLREGDLTCITEAAAEIERLTAALSRAEAQREALVKALVLAGERLEVAAERVDRADTEFGFRTWAHEARHAAIDNGLAGERGEQDQTKGEK